MLLPFLLFITVIATDWARLFFFTITVQACARNGALYASDEIAAAKSPYPNLKEAALAEAPNLTATATVTSETINDVTGHRSVVVTVSVPFQTISNFPGVPSNLVLTRRVQMRVLALATR